MTSNMGTRELKNNEYGFGENKKDKNYVKMKEGIMEKVQKIFSPELMNRIDESIVFQSLNEQNVYDIIDLQLSDLIQNLSKLGLSLKLTKTAKKLLAKSGYDPKYGVRLLRREIQRLLEDPISETMLKKGLAKGTVITVKAIRKSLHFTYKSGILTKRKKPKLPSK
jgi:ATP-dependent Clp protease ATP-binding subunit ClpC